MASFAVVAAAKLRSPLLPIFALLVLAQIAWFAIVPLLPSLSRSFHLSEIQAGAVLSSVSVAAIVVSPIFGFVVGRVGRRRLFRGIVVLLVVSCVGQAFAVDFWTLFAARAVFGVVYAGIWTVGPTLIAADRSAAAAAAALGATETFAGIGFLVAPAFAGATASAWGRAAPFLIVAVATLPFLAFVPRSPAPARSVAGRRRALAVGRVLRERHLLAGAAILVLVGFANSGVSLLVPLEFGNDGASAQTIGLILSAGSIGYVVASAVAARAGAAAARPVVGAVTAAVAAAATLFVLAGSRSWELAVYTFARAPAFGILATIAFPLGARGAERAQVEAGQVIGAFNFTWGVMSVAGPLVTGAVAHAAGARAAFVLLMVVALAVAGALALLSRDEAQAHDAAPDGVVL